MTIGLTRKSVSALARLDLSGMSHMQRIDAIARVFGHENNASLMSALKAEEKGPAAGLAAPAAKGAVVITAFGDRMSSCISAGYPVDADTEGDIVERRFGSEAEASAYLSGVEDATGWFESEFAAVKGAGAFDSNPEFFAERELNRDLTFIQWHNANIDRDEPEDEQEP